ncbi:hypothetical protein GCM10029963_03580 [Micromonospora andamanensis]
MCGWEQFVGPVDHGLLLSLLRQAIAANDALRLRFDEEDGLPFQWVEPEQAVVEIHDFRGASDPHQACHSWMARAFSRPFELHRNRMYRVALLRESESVSYAYLNAHHLVTDGWSARLLLRQVCAGYAAAVAGAAPPQPAPERLPGQPSRGRLPRRVGVAPTWIWRGTWPATPDPSSANGTSSTSAPASTGSPRRCSPTGPPAATGPPDTAFLCGGN